MAEKIIQCEQVKSAGFDERGRGKYLFTGCETRWVETEQRLKATEERLERAIANEPQKEQVMTRTKAVVLAEMDAEAKRIQASEPGLSDAQAYDRMLREQPQRYAEYKNAPEGDRAPEQPRTAQEGPAVGPAVRLVLDECSRKAAEIRSQQPRLTKEQAEAEVWMRYPAAYKRYLQALDLDKRR